VAYTAVVEADARARTRVPATLEDGGCRVRASLLIERGEAAAGSRVAVRGEAADAGALIVVQHATVVVLSRPGLADRAHAHAPRGHSISLCGRWHRPSALGLGPARRDHRRRGRAVAVR